MTPRRAIALTAARPLAAACAALMLLIARLGGELFAKAGQPAVLDRRDAVRDERRHHGAGAARPGAAQTREARVILGAAVVDDVMGLLILAVIAGAIRAAGAGESLALASVAVIALKSLAFLAGALLAGQLVVPHLFRGRRRPS